MIDAWTALTLYLCINTVIMVGVLYMGIVVQKDRVSGPHLAAMMALLLAVGLPAMVYAYASDKGE